MAVVVYNREALVQRIPNEGSRGAKHSLKSNDVAGEQGSRPRDLATVPSPREHKHDGISLCIVAIVSVTLYPQHQLGNSNSPGDDIKSVPNDNGICFVQQGAGIVLLSAIEHQLDHQQPVYVNANEINPSPCSRTSICSEKILFEAECWD